MKRLSVFGLGLSLLFVVLVYDEFVAGRSEAVAEPLPERMPLGALHADLPIEKQLVPPAATWTDAAAVSAAATAAAANAHANNVSARNDMPSNATLGRGNDVPPASRLFGGRRRPRRREKRQFAKVA